MGRCYWVLQQYIVVFFGLFQFDSWVDLIEDDIENFMIVVVFVLVIIYDFIGQVVEVIIDQISIDIDVWMVSVNIDVSLSFIYILELGWEIVFEVEVDVFNVDFVDLDIDLNVMVSIYEGFGFVYEFSG